MSKYYCVNGKIVLSKNATLQVSDLGLLRGYGIFDFLRVKKGVPLFIEAHLERFEHSASEMGLNLEYSLGELKKMVVKLIAKNEMKNGGLKIVLTGGYSDDGYLPAQSTNLVILLSEIKIPTKKVYEKGIKLMLHSHFRQMAMVKTTNYIVPIHLAKKLKKEKAADVLYHWNGKISESSRANFFIVKKDGSIVTSKSHVLKGITRKRVIDIARQHYKVIEKDISMRELKNAEEAFISSTTKKTLSVTQIDDFEVGGGKSGKVSAHLNELLEKEINDYIKNFK